MRYTTGDKFSFQLAGGLSNAFDMILFYVKLSRTGTNPEDFTQTLEFIQPRSVFFRKYEYDLGEFGLKDGDEFYIAFHDNSYPTRYVQIDHIRGPVKVMPDRDLLIQEYRASGLTHGYAIHQVGVVQNYSAIVANAGLNTINGNDFTVEFCYFDHNNNVVVLTSMPGQTLAREDYYTATFNYAFTQAGKFRTFIRVNYAQDENLSNNISNVITVDALPATAEFITSGVIDPNPNQVLTNHMVPVFFGTQSWAGFGSLMQTYHPKSHFNGTSGIITRYAYYINHPIVRTHRDIRIWMANSTLPSFNAPGTIYPNADEMELVFDGKLTFPRANKPFELFEIELQNPFFYTGEHLIVMIEYQGEFADGGTTLSSVVTREGRNYWKMSKPFDVNNINESGLQVYEFTPVTSFWIEKGNGVGTLSGKVAAADATTPIFGAKITITSATHPLLNAVAYTDATGDFMFPKIFATNDLKITISHLEYTDYVHENVILNVNDQVVLPLTTMQPRPQITVSGRVVSSDGQGGVEGVAVKFFGLENYETTTNINGIFAISDMWGSTTYKLELKHTDYQNYVGEAVFSTTATNLGDITILQTAHPINDLRATKLDDNTAQLSWYAPLSAYSKIFRRDDGRHWNNIIADGVNAQISAGPAFHEKATIQKIMWYQSVWDDIHPSTSTHIRLYGLHPTGIPNHQDLLGQFLNVPTTPNRWNEFVLPTEVEAPNGFMIGIAAASTRLVQATDFGTDPNWPWRPSTQWLVIGNTGEVYTIEGATGVRANFLVRAEGIWKGDVILAGSSSAPMAQAGETTEKNIQTNFEFSLTPKTGILTLEREELRSNEVVFNQPKTARASDYFGAPLPQIGYDIYRAFNSDPFTKINNTTIIETLFNDADFATLGRGEYQYAVKTIYAGGVESGLVYSNVLAKDMYVTININVTHNATEFDNSILEGAVISLVNSSRNYTGTLGETGVISSDEFFRGIYTLTINAVGFETYNQMIDFTTSDVIYNINIVLIEEIIKPYILNVEVDATEANFIWNPLPFLDGAEDHENFAITNFENWTLRDLTGHRVAHPTNTTWLNAGQPQAFTIFNPKLTNPPIAQAQPVPGRDWRTHEGDKYFVSFVSSGGYGITNSWMISKEFDFEKPFEVSFYVNALRWREPYRVLYSTGSDQVGHFIAVGGTRFAHASQTTWQKVTVQMPAEAKRIAFQHIPEYTDFGLMIDNITIGIPKQESRTFKHFEVYLDGEFVGETTDTDFRFTNLLNGWRQAGVVSVYASGKSAMSTFDFFVNNPFDIMAIKPEPDAVGVLLDTEISVLFNNDITENDLSGITINGNPAVATIVENKLTITHSNFYYETLYAVNIPAGTLVEWDDDITWSFTTGRSSYTITASVNDGNGTIEPSGIITVPLGQDQTFVFTPEVDYRIAQVLIDGVNNPMAVSNGNHTFTNVNAYHTIVVSFEEIPPSYVVGITPPTNGTITVMAGTTQVLHGHELEQGTELALTAMPNQHFKFVAWFDGVTTLTHSHVLENHVTIWATFESDGTSIVRTADGELLRVYPNPTSDVLHIQTEEIIKQIFVLDLNGKTVFSQRVGANNYSPLQGTFTIDVRSIPTGHYIIRIHTEKAIIPIRIVKN